MLEFAIFDGCQVRTSQFDIWSVSSSFQCRLPSREQRTGRRSSETVAVMWRQRESLPCRVS